MPRIRFDYLEPFSLNVTPVVADDPHLLEMLFPHLKTVLTLPPLDTVPWIPHGGLINSPFEFQRVAKASRRAIVSLSPFTRKNVRLLQRRQ